MASDDRTHFFSECVGVTKWIPSQGALGALFRIGSALRIRRVKTVVGQEKKSLPVLRVYSATGFACVNRVCDNVDSNPVAL